MQKIKKILKFTIQHKGIETFPQTLIFLSLYLWNQMLQTLDISNYEFCQIK